MHNPAEGLRPQSEQISARHRLSSRNPPSKAPGSISSAIQMPTPVKKPHSRCSRQMARQLVRWEPGNVQYRSDAAIEPPWPANPIV